MIVFGSAYISENISVLAPVTLALFWISGLVPSIPDETSAASIYDWNWTPNKSISKVLPFMFSTVNVSPVSLVNRILSASV